MPHRSRWRPSRITAVAGVLLAATLLVGTAASLWREKHQRVLEVSAHQALVARVLADHAGRSFDATDAALDRLADAIMRDSSAQTLQALFEQTQASLGFLRGIALMDDTARVIAATNAADRGARISPDSLGDWPAAGQRHIGGFVAGSGLSELTGHGHPAPPGVGFVPVLRGVGPTSGHGPSNHMVLVALINTDSLAEFQQRTLDDPRAAAALIDRDGQLMAATANIKHLAGQRLTTLLERARQGNSRNGWTGSGLRGAEQLGAYQAVPGRPLAVLVETPREGLRTQWLAAAADVGLPTAGVAALLLLLTAMATAALRERERSLAKLDAEHCLALEREQELSAIFGSVQDLLFRTDERGRVTFINEGYARLCGQPVAKALGQPLQAVFGNAPEVAALFEADAVQAMAPREARADWHGPDGQARSYEINLVPLRRQPGRLEWVGSATDVSSLVRAQGELAAQLGLAHSLLASSPLPMSVLDTENRYLDVNRAWEQFTGRKRDEVLGRKAASYLSAEEAAVHNARDAELLVSGGELNYETTWHSKEGRQRDLLVSKSTFPDANGRPMGIVVCLMDISDFREADRAARAARDAALGASQAKSEFIANVSHELRTPLQSILGFSELGAMRGRDQPRLAELFSDVHRAGQRMLSLVNDLLDLSKIERGLEPIQPMRLDMRPLALEIVRELAPLLSARNLMLDAQLGSEDFTVLADPLRLQQLLRNLLANAIRFSPVGGRIDLNASRDGTGEVRLTVADRGPGIPSDELERIFEAFVQSSANTAATGGTGLGLAICRRIAQAHGGRIWAANREGGGAIITLVLPAMPLNDSPPDVVNEMH